MKSTPRLSVLSWYLTLTGYAASRVGNELVESLPMTAAIKAVVVALT